MSGYGFGKKPHGAPPAADRIDLSGITRAPVQVDPAREAAAIERGAALGFVDREDRGAGEEAGVRRRRQSAPQGSVYIKGPRETLDWFVEYTNRRGHRSYWQTLEELRALVEREEAP